MISQQQYDDSRFAGFYNVGPNDCDCVTTGALVDMFCRSWGEGLSWVNKSDGGPHEANFLKLDCSKFKNTYSWAPKWHIEEAVWNTVEWSKAFSAGHDITDCMDQQINRFLMNE